MARVKNTVTGEVTHYGNPKKSPSPPPPVPSKPTGIIKRLAAKRAARVQNKRSVAPAVPSSSVASSTVRATTARPYMPSVRQSSRLNKKRIVEASEEIIATLDQAEPSKKEKVEQPVEEENTPMEVDAELHEQGPAENDAEEAGSVEHGKVQSSAELSETESLDETKSSSETASINNQLLTEEDLEEKEAYGRYWGNVDKILAEDAAGRYTRDCHYIENCPTVEKNARKVVSDAFGRNKEQTKVLPGPVWRPLCRKHYQRFTYNKTGTLDLGVGMYELIEKQAERIHEWGQVPHWDIQVTSTEVERQRAAKEREEKGEEPLEYNTHYPTKDDQKARKALGPDGRAPAERGVGPVPDWLAARCGERKSYKYVQVTLYLIYKNILQNDPMARFPSVEFLPNSRPYLDGFRFEKKSKSLQKRPNRTRAKAPTTGSAVKKDTKTATKGKGAIKKKTETKTKPSTKVSADKVTKSRGTATKRAAKA